MEIWKDIKEATIKLNISNGNISRCCSDKKRTCNNFKWGYVCGN